MHSPTGSKRPKAPSEAQHSTGDPLPITQLYYRLRSLRMAGAVLHLGAHPDDEDSGMIAYMAHRFGVRAVYWSATRGEGGQNRRSADKSEKLGIIRTWESLEARAFDGGEALYGPFRDFGFSKSGEDTLRRWNREELVREIVRAIRMTQPLIVVCRWSGGAQDGHGHHQAVGLVAAEAFDAAGDPARFPELTAQGLSPWQPKKLYRSVAGDWQPGESGTFGQIVDEYESAGYLRINTGEFDPVSGLSYQQQAALSINCHRSQGIGFVPTRGAYHHYYRLDRSLVPAASSREQDFFEGLDPTLAGLADYPGGGSQAVRCFLERARTSVEAAIDVFQPQRTAAAGLNLAEGLSTLSELRDSPDLTALDANAASALDAYLERTVDAFENAIAACLGLTAECHVDRPRPTPGRRVRAAVRVWNGGSEHASVLQALLHAPPGWKVRATKADSAPAEDGALFAAHYELELPPTATMSTPYWLRERSTPYRYRWPATGAIAQPLDPSLVVATFTLQVGPHRIRLAAPAVYRGGFAGGFRELPLSVVPPVAVSPRLRRELLPVARAATRIRLDVTVRCIEDNGTTEMLSVAAPKGWTAEPAQSEITFSRQGESRVLRFDLVVPAETKAGVYELRYQHGRNVAAVDVEPVRAGGQLNAAPVNETNCTHEAFCIQPATVDIHLVDTEFVSALNYGYVSGLSDDILPALERFGLRFVLLSDDDLAFVDLKTFQAIVIGPNAYNSRAALRTHSARVLDYVASGGVLIVQYQGYGYDAEGLAPYPFRYHQPHDRVTAPEALVTLLDPAHPLFQFPNALSNADFEGWVVDRGLYFFGEWDRRYVPLLASNDQGEEPQRGGLMVAAYERGTYIYTAYSLFRQIPAGVPGAIRLFANLLGMAEARLRQRVEFLRSVELFISMSPEQLYEIARLMHERQMIAGEYLAREGDHGSELFIVTDGTIDAVRSADGEERIVHTAGRGEAIGEFAILASIPRSADLRARDDATLFVLPAAAFQDMLRRHTDLSLRVMDFLVRKLVAQNRNM